MEEINSKFKGECYYVSNADVRQRFGRDKNFPEESLKMILEAKNILKVVIINWLLMALKMLKESMMNIMENSQMNVVKYIFFRSGSLFFVRERDFDNKKEMKAEEDKKEKELSEATDSHPAVVVKGSIDTKVKVETSEFMKETAFSSQEVSLDGNLSKICLTDEHSVVEEGFAKQWLSAYHRKLALKYLEDAKLVFERQNTVEAELKLAETLRLFGNIYLSGAYISSVIQEYKRSEKYMKST